MARADLRSGLWYSRQLAEGEQVGRELAVYRDRRPAALRGRGVQADRLARARARLGRVCAAWKALLGGAQAACAACGSPSSSLGTQIATPSAPNACSSRTWSRRDACAARGASRTDSWPRTALQRASSSTEDHVTDVPNSRPSEGFHLPSWSAAAQAASLASLESAWATGIRSRALCSIRCGVC